MNRYAMTREQSSIIKGLAIILMLVYHLDNIPGLSSFDGIIAETLKTASHPINYFLIVSGYGLCVAQEQGRLTISYIVKRSLRLYLAYWLVLLVFVFSIGSLLYPGHFSLPIDKTVLSIIGWRWDYCPFTWFLFPYIMMSLSSKWILQVIDYLGNTFSLLCSSIIYLLTSVFISRYYESYFQTHYFVYHVILWFQTLFGFTLGAVMARCTLGGRTFLWNKLKARNLLITTLLILSFIIRGQIHISLLNPFYAGLVVWLILHIEFGRLPKSIMTELGNKSMIMWLAQGFIAVEMFSEYFVQLRWPLLVWLAWTMVTYLVACMFLPITNYVAKSLKLK